MTQTLEHKHANIGERVDVTAAIDIEGSSDTGLPYGELVFKVSNSATDRYGESITMSGIDTSEVSPDRNPVVCWAHDYDALPIGKILKTYDDGTNLFAHVKLATEVYEFADTAYKLAIGGYINACSIGGLVKSYGLDESNKTDYSLIDELEMVELSLVPVPAHRDALIAAKALHMKPEEIKEQYSDFVARAMISLTTGSRSEDIVHQIETLKNLTSALESTLGAARDPVETTTNKRVVRYRLSVRSNIARSLQQTIQEINAGIKSQMRGTQNDRENRTS